MDSELSLYIRDGDKFKKYNKNSEKKDNLLGRKRERSEHKPQR